MKKRTLIVLGLVSVTLMSCARTKETYAMNYLDTGKFETNFYTEQKGVKSNEVSSIVELPLVTSFTRYWDGSTDENKHIDGIRDEDQTVNGQQLNWNEDEDTATGYGPNKCLSEKKESFKEGILSRLYDGRVRCDKKTFARTRIQINEDGYSCFFPSTLESGKYMALALRGATNLESSGTECNLATVDLKVSLFQKLNDSSYREIKFTMKDAPVETNTHGKTELLSFYFDKAFEENGISDYSQYLSNVTAMSVGYELKTAANIKLGEQFALMLYEFFLPESTWR